MRLARASTPGRRSWKGSPRKVSVGMPEFAECSGRKLKSMTIWREEEFFFGTVRRGESINAHGRGLVGKGPAVTDKLTSLGMN